MAFLLGCEKVRVEFPTKTVFESISLGLSEGCRIGVVGGNGHGKSTLLNVLAGTVEPDEGRVIRTRGVTVGMLEQADSFANDITVRQAIAGDAPDYEWMGSAANRDILAGLVSDVDLDAQVGTLSGGQRRRVDLARLLIGTWDVLLLDEPTNHLDMRGIAWLSNHLKHRWKPGTGALVVVTHDRWFLDEVCLDMWEVHDKRIDPFEGGFSAYIMQRVERDRLEALAEEKRQNKLRRELAWLSRGARARATKPKFHVAEAQALIADVPELRNTLELKRMAMARIGKQVVDFTNVTYSVGGHAIVRNTDWEIGPGDRYGILGENGAGKTTLLRLLQGKVAPQGGFVKIGKTVKFAYLSQNLDELKAYGADRVRQVIARYTRRVMLDGKESTPAQLLERLGFSRADLNEPVCDLSGGQKRRLALMLILLDEPNVLILDEPGNDLDVDMLAAVEDLLDGWPGTLVLVTHDRYLMERVTDNQFVLKNGTLRHLPGGVDQYLKECAEEGQLDAPARVSIGASGGQKTQGSASVDEATQPAASKLSGGEQRELRKLMQSNERKVETLKGKIDEVHARMATVDMSDYVELGKYQAQAAELQAQIDQLETEWLEAAEKLGL